MISTDPPLFDRKRISGIFWGRDQGAACAQLAKHGRRGDGGRHDHGRCGGARSGGRTLAYNSNQQQSRLLARGIVEWLTQGVHLGQTRNSFAVPSMTCSPRTAAAAPTATGSLAAVAALAVREVAPALKDENGWSAGLVALLPFGGPRTTPAHRRPAAPPLTGSLPYALFGLATGVLVLYAALGDVLAGRSTARSPRPPPWHSP